LHFIKQIADFDLGDTPIENIFINDFMPMANGTYVKVYLLGYKYANDKDPSLSINHRTIAKHLNIPLSDVLDAWDFWEQKGIIKKLPSKTEDSTEYSVEFLNLKQLYVYNNFKAANAAKEDEEPSKPYYCSPSDLVEATKVPEFKEMFRYIDQIYRRPLHPNEKKKVLDWVYNYNMDTDLIVRAFMYCVEQRNAKSLKYIGAVITTWYDNGITNMDQLDKHLEKTDTRYNQYRKIYKFLGMNTNEIPEPTKKIMNKWIVQWNFSMDIILKACETAVKGNKINFNYIDGILNMWKENNVQSLKDLEEIEQARKPSSPHSNGLEKSNLHYGKYREIYKFLGIAANEIPEPTKKIMDKWLLQWNFSMDIILKACETAVKRNIIKFAYIDSILNSWKDANVQTIEDIPKIEKPLKRTQAKSKKYPANKFHNFEQRTSRYSNAELEKILGIKK
jgi:DnaD/phage-associated family protein